MRVLGVTGRNGSGKDTVAEILRQRCGAGEVSVGDVVRELADEEGVEATRENLHEVSSRYLRERGNDFFARRVVERVQRRDERVVSISGVRTPVEVDVYRAQFGDDFLLAYVRVGDQEIRYDRSRRRGETRDKQSREQFAEQDRRENEIYRLDETIARADVVLDNGGTLEQLKRQVQQHIVDGWLGAACCRQGREAVRE
jgi:dephospho-CoA kinase